MGAEGCGAMDFAWWRQAVVTCSTSALKVLFLATKSVSQLTSTMAMHLSDGSEAIPMRPCAVARPSNLVAFAQPKAFACSCSHFSAWKNTNTTLSQLEKHSFNTALILFYIAALKNCVFKMFVNLRAPFRSCFH